MIAVYSRRGAVARYTPASIPPADIENFSDVIVFQYEKMGYTLGYRDLDKMRDYIYDAVAGFNRVCSLSLC